MKKAYATVKARGTHAAVMAKPDAESLAAALRENLRKRKERARGERGESGPGGSAGGGGNDGTLSADDAPSPNRR